MEVENITSCSCFIYGTSTRGKSQFSRNLPDSSLKEKLQRIMTIFPVNAENNAENLCSISKLVYYDMIANADRVLYQLVMFLTVLFIGFLVKKCAACQSRKSYFGWHRFRFFTLLDA